MSIVDIIIPTWNNNQYLVPCVQSIYRHTIPEDLFRIIIVNNGEPENMAPFQGSPQIEIVQMSGNAGWEGGLKAGLEVSKSKYVMFLNDDTMVPSHQRLWLHKLLGHFADINCAAVGPTSNVVMGKQNIFIGMPEERLRVKFLIGFCVLVRRADLDAAGGIDLELPGGDDLDMSIRLRKLGKYLLVDRDVFVYHHGFKTGERVEGTPDVVGGWNSIQKIEKTNHALINKHGLRAYLDLWAQEPTLSGSAEGWGDREADLVREYVAGEKVAELGCGDKKVVPNSVGIDITPKGERIAGLHSGALSVADILANVEHDLPIEDFDTITAQHIIEHIVDTTGALGSWAKSLKVGGRLIIAVPDHTARNTIVMNYQHVRAFTPTSLRKQMESIGWKTVVVKDCENLVSFIGVFEKTDDTYCGALPAEKILVGASNGL